MGLVGGHTSAHNIPARPSIHPPGSAGGTGGMAGRSEHPGRAVFFFCFRCRPMQVRISRYLSFRGGGGGVIDWAGTRGLSPGLRAFVCVWSLLLFLLLMGVLLSSPPAWVWIGMGSTWARPRHPVCGWGGQGMFCPASNSAGVLLLLSLLPSAVHLAPGIKQAPLR